MTVTASEEQRQADEAATAIWQALHQHNKALLAAGRAPVLNAVLGALMVIEAEMLARIADPGLRKQAIRELDRMRPRKLAEALKRPGVPAAEIVTRGGRRH